VGPGRVPFDVAEAKDFPRTYDLVCLFDCRATTTPVNLVIEVRA
jgi:hypothetical protein